jgi:hypothetical protein
MAAVHNTCDMIMQFVQEGVFIDMNRMNVDDVPNDLMQDAHKRFLASLKEIIVDGRSNSMALPKTRDMIVKFTEAILSDMTELCTQPANNWTLDHKQRLLQLQDDYLVSLKKIVVVDLSAEDDDDDEDEEQAPPAAAADVIEIDINDDDDEAVQPTVHNNNNNNNNIQFRTVYNTRHRQAQLQYLNVYDAHVDDA